MSFRGANRAFCGDEESAFAFVARALLAMRLALLVARTGRWLASHHSNEVPNILPV